MRRILRPGLATLGLLGVVCGLAADKASAQGSCMICRECAPHCSCPPSYTRFNICCGAGGGPGCTPPRQLHLAFLRPCESGSLPDAWAWESASRRAAFLVLTGLQGAIRREARELDDGPGEVRLDWDGVSRPRYTVSFDRPAVALFLEVVFEGPRGGAVRGSTVYDNFLREGSQTLSGTVPWVPGNWRVEARVRYVEYADGSFEGDLPEHVVSRVFLEVRETVRRYARRYGELVRSGGRAAVEAALAAEKPTSTAEKTAVDQIRVNLNSAADEIHLIEVLHRLAGR